VIDFNDTDHSGQSVAIHKRFLWERFGFRSIRATHESGTPISRSENASHFILDVKGFSSLSITEGFMRHRLEAS
jgi:hypothetical protein